MDVANGTFKSTKAVSKNRVRARGAISLELLLKLEPSRASLTKIEQTNGVGISEPSESNIKSPMSFYRSRPIEKPMGPRDICRYEYIYNSMEFLVLPVSRDTTRPFSFN